MDKNNKDLMQKIVALCKRRGFVYPSSEIYGGLSNVYDYGPLGVELLRNIRELWWKTFIQSRSDIVGIESAIFMHPQVWVASGHVGGFSDPLTEDKVTHKRYRADHLIEDWNKSKCLPEVDTDKLSIEELNQYILDNKLKSPDGNELTPIKQFNLMFETQLGTTGDNMSKIYLRAETAQGMYVDYQNILDSSRVKIPFGVAQQGRVFRNEITTGKFLFRMLEFQQMEIQYFFNGKDWEVQFESWRKEIENWYINILGVDKEKTKWKPHSKLVFYAKAAEDLQYQFSWGFDEVSGLHYRTDYDLATHQKHSGKDLQYLDQATGEKYLPHVLETTWGLDRNFFMVLDNAYTETEDGRVILKLNPKIAPYKVAVFPLVANKEDIIAKAKEVYDALKPNFMTAWDDRGNIGKRYAAQDEAGTPWCVTVDYTTLEDNTVTVRDRDTGEQTRLPADELVSYFQGKLS